jgi:hypothetical protein
MPRHIYQHVLQGMQAEAERRSAEIVGGDA